MGSLIYGHDPSKIENILGKISRAWVEARRGHAEIAMDDDDSGNQALIKIQTGSLTGVSVGYMINQAQRIEEGESWTDPDGGQTYDGPAMIATRWTPYEISMTPTPADPSVGIGRTLTRSLDGIEILNQTRHNERSTTMADLARSISKNIQNGMQDTRVKSGLVGLAIDNCESAGDHEARRPFVACRPQGARMKKYRHFIGIGSKLRRKAPMAHQSAVSVTSR